MSRRRAREVGLRFEGQPGPLNAITDVAGIGVGMTTLIEAPAPGRHAGLCTGVTAIVPRLGFPTLQPVWAGLHSFNGNGELTGSHWIRDGGWFLGPVLLTNTHSVGIVHHAAIRWLIQNHASELEDRHQWFMPVVGETYDGILNDINAQAITEQHVLAALDTAVSGPVEEGNVGGGTGMIAYEYKGGTGTSSRQVEIVGEDYMIGVLVQANHGMRDWLRVSGIPVGQYLRDDLLLERETGSVIVVIATDCPLLPHQLDRVARRGAIGISQNGTVGGNSSGDIFLAFTTARSMRIDREAPVRQSFDALDDRHLDTIYAASVQAIEEAVVNAMVAAEDRVAVKPPGRMVKAMNVDQLLEIIFEFDHSVNAPE
ncbi:P1 family peptidase [uncultured Jannaschia sp.]|uniref:DmpA family aminopeptidase n=1 Tax=uncultured Jannaschia sp. TaxID=293347 RepID=UPI00260F13B8|nr:P1 family peptidase [uncultured Jannaschia sp.]